MSNNDIIGELHDLARLAGKSSHRWYAYMAAARSIGDLQYNLRDAVAEGRHPKISHVGDKIWKTVVEYYTSGTTSARREMEARADDRRVLMGVKGVGEVTADEWIASGVTTLAELRRAAASGKIRLTDEQRLGLRYYDDLQLRIPHSEVSQIFSEIRLLAPDAHMECVGSYRRGLPDSGDVDIIVRKDAASTAIATAIATRKCGEKPIHGCVETLSRGRSRVSFLYRGWVYMRQVDLLYVVPAEYGAAILYFTGSWDFNEAMRSLAKKQGLRLNQMGLFDRATGQLIHAETEEGIFRALNLAYVPPHERTGARALVAAGGQ